MYNGHIISVLLKERGLKAKDLLEFLQIKSNGSVTALVHGNPTAERLEKMADYFEVPVDAFFERSENYGKSVAAATAAGLRAENDGLRRVIEEKDKRIALLEDMVALLKAGQKS